MKESLLLKVSLACAVIGITALWFSAEQIKVAELGISEISGSDSAGKDVRIKGIVSRISEKNKTMFVEIAQLQKIDVVLFKSADTDLHEGDYIEIAGAVEEYKGKKEVIGSIVKR